MANSIAIGRIFGIRIDLHWTFLLLLVFSLFIGTYFFLIIVLLFVCVLVHEIAHSVTALRNNVKVKSIILLPIGGASMIDDTQMHPQVEFKIALAGPIMSLFLGALFGLLVIFTPLGTLTQIVQTLFLLNILLGVFNILPAFPMDGGRVFRSYLQRTKNFYDATMLTVKVSNYLMALIVIGTLVFVAFANSYSLGYREFLAFWNFIIVFFLYGGAQAEKQNLVLKRQTQGLYISDAISKRYLLAKPTTTLAELYSLMKRKKEQIVLIKIGAGYLYADVFKKIKAQKYVRDISVPIPQVSPKTNVVDALSKMQNMDVGVIAIVSKGRLLGITTSRMLQALISMHVASTKTRRKVE
ncbi:MAG: site-2 protease family protein [Candidatus Micrarchaeales archaeon]